MLLASPPGCGLLPCRVLQARDKQMARLAREEALAGLPLQLANGKRLRVGALQGASRVVIAAGTQQQVRQWRCGSKHAACVCCVRSCRRAAVRSVQDQLVLVGTTATACSLFGMVADCQY